MINDINPSSEKVKQLAGFAKVAEADGHHSTAFEIYRRLLNLAPERESAIYRAAQNLIQIGRLSDAEALLMRLKWNAAPKPWLIDLALGDLRSAQGRFREAEKHFANAWKLNPQTTETAILLAHCLFKQEKFDEAKNVLVASVEAKGDLDELYLNLGLIERAKGNYDSARDYFIKALKITPEYPIAQKALDDVQSYFNFAERGVL